MKNQISNHYTGSKRAARRALCLVLVFLYATGMGLVPGIEKSGLTVAAEAASTPYMKITCIDLGSSSSVYGEAVLLESAGQYLLMDTGSKDSHNTVINYLKKRGIKTLSLYISHFHEDHCAYASTILKDSYFSVKRLYLANPDPMRIYATSKYKSRKYKLYNSCKNYIGYYNSIFSAAHKRKVPVTALRKGKTFKIGSVRASVLWDHNTRGFSSFDPYDVSGVGFQNNNSVVTKFTLGSRSFLTCGDIEFSSERDLLASGVNLSADILKLNHHGIWTSNLDSFVKAVNPCYCFYSYKSKNSDPEYKRFASASDVSSTVKRLAKKYNILSSRYNGNITYKVQDNTIFVSAQRHVKKAKIQVQKTSNGKKYTQTIVYNDAQKLFLDKRMLLSGTKRVNGSVENRTPGYSGWKKYSKGWRYRTTKGKWLAGGWKTIGEKVYYFTKSGYRYEGWLTLKGKKYFMSRLGVRQTGWQMIDGKFYYFSTYPGKVGVMLTGRTWIGNSWWPLRSDGSLNLSKKNAPNYTITTSEHRHTTK